MSTIHITKEPVVLDGFQAIMKPGEYGHKLSALIPKKLVDTLEDERESCLEWARNKAKNPKRVTVKHPPWEEVEGTDTYQIRFSWKQGDKVVPTIVDTEGTLITDTNTPVYSGSKVKLAFIQKPYLLPAGDIGTSVKLKSVQIVSIQSGAGVSDEGNLSAEDAADLFGKTKGFKAEDPAPQVETTPCSVEEDEDF
jgi:hypothetical protein